jgi:neutral ceramidase
MSVFSKFSSLLALSCIANAAYADRLQQCDNNTRFNVGAGIYDITGPAAEEGMMGYGMIGQKTSGIYQRLWARAFVIESPCNKKRVVFVNADLGMVFQGVKQAVIKKLKSEYGDLYDDTNVLLTATHTHSGPGGFSTYVFYNLTTLGFNRDNFDVIVDGIVNAIERAHANVVPAQIKIAYGEIKGVNHNRSPQSYLQNSAQERAKYNGDTDTQMTLIRFDQLDGKPIGMINWFPIHGVSLNNKNYYISPDNKGYAEYFFEKDFHSDYGPHAFVAAFAQANSGDVTPNEFGHEGGTGSQGLKFVEQAGKPQYETAKKLYNQAIEVVTGAIDYRHEFIDMSKVTIAPEYANGKKQVTCPAAIGVSMLAGTQDGEGYGWQGIKCDELSGILTGAYCAMSTTDCQGVKPIAVETGAKQPHWTPDILPLQVFSIGNFTVAAVPFELTTMTGRRIREAVMSQLPAGNYVELSALSNAYAGYVATPEEYQLQRYEGASTHFGPWQAAALVQEFSKLTKALVQNAKVDAGPDPIDYTGPHIDMQPGVWFDSAPINGEFGDIADDVSLTYHPGDTVKVAFWGGHPKNNFHIQDSYLEVQQLKNGIWTTIRHDWDWDTEYHWMRSGISQSYITIVWRMGNDVERGQYRIVHHGDSKSVWGGHITPYVGYSSVFMVQ